jgi:hypothetical protein
MADRLNVNSASRLLALLEHALNRPHDHTQLRVWADVFHVDNLSGRPQIQAVSEGIVLMFRQLDRMVEQLKAAGHPESTYRELVQTLDTNISPAYLNHGWKDFSVRLSAAKYPLTMLVNFLKDEENLIAGSDLAEVSQELDRLEKSLEEKEVATEVRRFVRSQIDTIRKAIWEYQFRGAEVFQDAMLQTFRDYANSEVAEKYENDPTIREVSSLWERILKFSSAADKVQRGLTAFYKMWELAEKSGIHHILKLPHHHS